MKVFKIEPSSVTYNSLIDGMVRTGNIEKAWELFEEMKIKGLKQDNFTYSSLIKGIKSDKSHRYFNKTIKLFRSLKTSDFNPDEIL